MVGVLAEGCFDRAGSETSFRGTCRAGQNVAISWLEAEGGASVIASAGPDPSSRRRVMWIRRRTQERRASSE